MQIWVKVKAFISHTYFRTLNVFLLWLDTIDLVRDLSMPLDICYIHVSCVEYYDQYLSGLRSRSHVHGYKY